MLRTFFVFHLYFGGLFHMNHVPVSSSNLRSVGYDPDHSILEITFISGGTYQYKGVSPSLYRSLLAAASKGQFFRSFIKDVFPCMRVA
ncbi:KTSC domain-containing protein [Bilophila wadsworthia]|uniref:KTSC domain-containing protein n=2 Tax=Bilophila wadsworthia TaxID=35833 RepID=UPI003520DB3E